MIYSQIYLIKYSTCFGNVHCPSSGVSRHCVRATGSCHARAVGVYQRGHSDHASRHQQNQHDQYLLRVNSVDMLLMMDSGHFRNMQSTLSNKFERQCISAFIIRTASCIFVEIRTLLYGNGKARGFHRKEGFLCFIVSFHKMRNVMYVSRHAIPVQQLFSNNHYLAE